MMNNIHAAYLLFPALVFPLYLVWKIAFRTQHPGLKMIAMQFSIIAGFDILIDCLYSLCFQDSLIENAFSEKYLMSSFLASVIQYNVFAITLFWVTRKKTQSAFALIYGEKEIKFLRFYIVTAGFFALYYVVVPMLEGLSLVSYGNALMGESLEQEGSSENLSSFFINLGTLFAPLYLVMRNKKNQIKDRLINYTSYMLIFIFLLKLLTGARAAIFTLLLYFLSAQSLLNKKYINKYTFLIGAAVLFVFINFAAISSARLSGQQLSITDAWINIRSGVLSSGGSSLGTSLRGLAWRSAGARMGAVLFHDVDRHGCVGIEAVINNLYSVVPRMLWQGKPNGNSIDGSVSGMATYQVSQIIRGTQNTNNQSDSVSSAAVAYWILGWPGVILSGFFSALVVGYCLRVSKVNRQLMPWLWLLAITLGGWFLVTDLGTWIFNLTRVGFIMYLVHLAQRVRFSSKRNVYHGTNV